MATLLSIFKGIAAHASLAASQIRMAILALLAGFPLLILLMWGFNVLGLAWVNYLFFFAGTVVIVAFVLNAGVLVATLLTGGLAGWVSGKGFARGLADGPSLLFNLTLTLLLAFWGTSGLLATASFAQSPESFFRILVIIIIAGGFMTLLGRRFLPALFLPFLLYATFVLFGALWSLVPVSAKHALGLGGSSILAVERVAGRQRPEVMEEIRILVKEEQEALRIRLSEKRRQQEAQEQAERLLAHQRQQDAERKGLQARQAEEARLRREAEADQAEARQEAARETAVREDFRQRLARLDQAAYPEGTATLLFPSGERLIHRAELRYIGFEGKALFPASAVRDSWAFEQGSNVNLVRGTLDMVLRVRESRGSASRTAGLDSSEVVLVGNLPPAALKLKDWKRVSAEGYWKLRGNPTGGILRMDLAQSSWVGPTQIELADEQGTTLVRLTL